MLGSTIISSFREAGWHGGLSYLFIPISSRGFARFEVQQRPPSRVRAMLTVYLPPFLLQGAHWIDKLDPTAKLARFMACTKVLRWMKVSKDGRTFFTRRRAEDEIESQKIVARATLKLEREGNFWTVTNSITFRRLLQIAHGGDMRRKIKHESSSICLPITEFSESRNMWKCSHASKKLSGRRKTNQRRTRAERNPFEWFSVSIFHFFAFYARQWWIKQQINGFMGQIFNMLAVRNLSAFQLENFSGKISSDCLGAQRINYDGKLSCFPSHFFLAIGTKFPLISKKIFPCFTHDCIGLIFFVT